VSKLKKMDVLKAGVPGVGDRVLAHLIMDHRSRYAECMEGDKGVSWEDTPVSQSPLFGESGVYGERG
jgi:hypothetical protein